LTLTSPVDIASIPEAPISITSTNGELTVSGFVEALIHPVSNRLIVDGSEQEFSGSGEFSFNFPVQTVGSTGYVEHSVFLSSIDGAGGKAVLAAILFAPSAGNQSAPTVTIRVVPTLLQGDVHSFASGLGGTIVDANSQSGIYVIEFPAGTEMQAKTSVLRNVDGVLFAVRNPIFENDSFPSEFQYINPVAQPFPHLSQSPGRRFTESKACLSDADCGDTMVCADPDSSPNVFDGEDHCTNEAGKCVTCSHQDADIGWDESVSNIEQLQMSGASVKVVVADSNEIFNWRIPDLRPRVWSNPLECCGRDSTCLPGLELAPLPDCTMWEAISDVSCSPPACGCPIPGSSQPAKRIHVPEHARCLTVLGYAAIPGDICIDDTSCGFQAPKCDDLTGRCTAGTVTNLCSSDEECRRTDRCVKFPEIDLCSDGVPGRRGVDDDGDGYSDFDDPEVKDLLFGDWHGLLANGIDDDFSCYNATYNPTSTQEYARYDPILHPNGCIDDPGEALLAAFDDDENGYIDDIHGTDMYIGRKAKFGRLWESTHDNMGVRAGITTERNIVTGFAKTNGGKHTTAMATVLGAQTNNGPSNDVATGWVGVAPNVQLVALPFGGSTFEPFFEYGSRIRADIVVISAGAYLDPSDSASIEEYQNEFKDWNFRAQSVMDSNILYVFSAGNERVNLDLATQPDSGALFRIPQNLTPKRALIVGSSGIKDKFSDWWWGCSESVWADPVLNKKFCVQESSSVGDYPRTGSNRGASTVDLCAPGESIFTGSYQVEYNCLIQMRANGTSFSAPIAAGVAAVLISSAPERYRNNPELIIQRLKQTVESNASNGTDSYAGMVEAQGRVDIANALNVEDYPLEEAPPWEDVSWQLGESGPTENRGIVLFTELLSQTDPVTLQTTQVLADVLIRTYGISSDDSIIGYPPTVQVAIPAGGKFQHLPDALPEGLDYFLPGGLVAGDINRDGCKDLLIGGFLEEDPDPADDQILPFQGSRVHMLIQNTDANGWCRGTFHEENSYPMTSTAFMSRRIVLADFNLDENLDVLISGTHYPTIPGGQHGLLLYLGDGDGSFTDISWLVPDDEDMDGYGLAACDIDGDGDLDIIQSGRGEPFSGAPPAQIPHVIMNLYTPGYALEFSALDPSTSGFQPIFRGNDISCADLDDDSKPDLIAIALQDNVGNSLYENNTTELSGVEFLDVSNRLPDLTSGQDGFDYIHQRESTQSIPICRLEDSPDEATLFYGNGNINNRLFQANAVMRFDETAHAYSVNESLGFGFDKSLDLTAKIICSDLDGNGLTDTVFVANHGKSYLYRYRGNQGGAQ